GGLLWQQAAGGERGKDAGYRETADRLRLPPAHDLLPADRRRGVDDRADGVRGDGVGGRLLRGDAGDRARGGRGRGAGEGCAVHRAATPARRGDGGAEAGAALAGGWVIAGSMAPRAGRFRRGEGKG